VSSIFGATMLNRVLVILACFIFGSAYAQEEQIIRTILDHREAQRQEFLDPEKTPLEKRDLRKFKGLNYYPIDLSFHVKAKLVVNESPVLFKMPTTTTRLPEYSKYGELHFTLQGKEYMLEVYQNPEISKTPGYEDYLFIPFTDKTNGTETYDVGRYLEFRIPTSEDIYIDFNLCYNPYCSYNSRFSCPIPPSQNHLPIAVTAGEKKFHAERSKILSD
jgi:uncharacterized protein (DUF1684 family)